MGYYTRHSVYLEVFDEYKMNKLDRLLRKGMYGLAIT